jgi:hypothetical protein
LLIHRPEFQQDSDRKVLILRQKPGVCSGYSKQEFQVSDINEVAPLVKDCLEHPERNKQPVEISTRDILVCTHGSHDKCCAKYGNVFYRQAVETVAQLSLERVRVWQASHIGGHRFAPTAIDFPEGRYYGRLNPIAFAAILQRSGDIDWLNRVYRGWGILPHPVQVLERKLIQIYGWDWFNHQVTGQILEQSEDERFSQVELTLSTSNGAVVSYRADVVADDSKSICVRGSCDSPESCVMPEYDVQKLIKVQTH